MLLFIFEKFSQCDHNIVFHACHQKSRQRGIVVTGIAQIGYLLLGVRRINFWVIVRYFIVPFHINLEASYTFLKDDVL